VEEVAVLHESPTNLREMGSNRRGKPNGIRLHRPTLRPAPR
jgi:hypothetical protein